MSDQELALGQREIVEGIEFTEAELELITSNGVDPQELIAFVLGSGVQTINAAIGGLKGKVEADLAEQDVPPSEPAPETPSEEAEKAPEAGEEPKSDSEPTGEAPTAPAAE